VNSAHNDVCKQSDIQQFQQQSTNKETKVALPGYGSSGYHQNMCCPIKQVHTCSAITFLPAALNSAFAIVSGVVPVMNVSVVNRESAFHPLDSPVLWKNKMEEILWAVW